MLRSSPGGLLHSSPASEATAISLTGVGYASRAAFNAQLLGIDLRPSHPLQGSSSAGRLARPSSAAPTREPVQQDLRPPSQRPTSAGVRVASDVHAASVRMSSCDPAPPPPREAFAEPIAAPGLARVTLHAVPGAKKVACKIVVTEPYLAWAAAAAPPSPRSPTAAAARPSTASPRARCNGRRRKSRSSISPAAPSAATRPRPAARAAARARRRAARSSTRPSLARTDRRPRCPGAAAAAAASTKAPVLDASAAVAAAIRAAKVASVDASGRRGAVGRDADDGGRRRGGGGRGRDGRADARHARAARGGEGRRRRRRRAAAASPPSPLSSTLRELQAIRARTDHEKQLQRRSHWSQQVHKRPTTARTPPQPALAVGLLAAGAELAPRCGSCRRPHRTAPPLPATGAYSLSRSSSGLAHAPLYRAAPPVPPTTFSCRVTTAGVSRSTPHTR